MDRLDPRWYGAVFVLGALYHAVAAARSDPPQTACLLGATAAACLLAGCLLLLRVRWGRPVGAGLLVGVTLYLLVTPFVRGVPFTVWRGLVVIWCAWSVLDLARSPVTTDELRAVRREESRALTQELMVRDQAAALLRDKVDAVVATSRGCHESLGHLGSWEECTSGRCAEDRTLMRSIREKIAEYSGVEPQDPLPPG